MPRRNETQNKLVLIFLSVALLFFAAFHFLPFEQNDRDRGWEFWPDILRTIVGAIKNPELLGDSSATTVIAFAALLTIPLLLIGSPFLMPVYKSSRIFHGLALTLSLVSTAGFTGMALAHWNSNSRPGSGLICLMVAQVLNMIGLALVKTGKPRRGEMMPPQ